MKPDITEAWTIPSAFYTDESIFQESADKIFARNWQFTTWLDQVKVPGSVYPLMLLPGFVDEPLLFTRSREDELHLLSNVCTHRGNLVCEGAGNLNSLRCRYHGRRFSLDGKFQSMPEFEEVKNFPCQSDDLPHIPFGEWRNFYFTKLSDSAVTIGDVFAEIEQRVGWMPIEQFIHAPERKRDYLINAHWALYVDNYLEGFHIPYIHAALNATLDYGNYRTELIKHGNLQVGFAGTGEPAFDLPESSADYGSRIGAYYYWLFPNLMLNFYPWGLSVNIIQPLAVNRTKVTFLPFVWKPELIGEGAGGDLDRVEREDEVVVEMTMKGVGSRFYDRGRYSPKRELGVHQFHQMIAEAMNRE